MKPLYLLPAFVLFLAACYTPQIAFKDDDGSPTERYIVQGRQGLKIREKLSFGDYYTTNIQRSWTRGRSSMFGVPDVLLASYEKRKQTFRFKLADKYGNSSEVYCITQVRTEELIIGRNPNNLFNILIKY